MGDNKTSPKVVFRPFPKRRKSPQIQYTANNYYTEGSEASEASKSDLAFYANILRQKCVDGDFPSWDPR